MDLISDVNTYLAFKHGDLLLLAEGITGEALRKNQFVRGENTRTGLQGNIPVELVYVLPTITKPTMEIMVNFFSKHFHNFLNAFFHFMSDFIKYYCHRTFASEVHRTKI